MENSIGENTNNDNHRMPSHLTDISFDSYE